jgi:hypothetical protein
MQIDMVLADIGPAAGRYVLLLGPRWAIVAVEPVAGAFALALVLDGELVDVLDEPDEVAAYLAGLPAGWIGGEAPRSLDPHGATTRRDGLTEKSSAARNSRASFADLGACTHS